MANVNVNAAGPRERLRELGLRDLADAELVALVLGTGVVGEPVALLAASLLDEMGGLEGMARAGHGLLAEKRGLGLVRAMRIAASFELGRRASVTTRLPWLPDSRHVAEWARAKLGTLDHEELWALALDGRHRVRAARRVAAGGLHGMRFVGARSAALRLARGRERVRHRAQSPERRSHTELGGLALHRAARGCGGRHVDTAARSRRRRGRPVSIDVGRRGPPAPRAQRNRVSCRFSVRGWQSVK